MEVFLKRLGSQESGYSGDRPNQRGKYILIPTEYVNAFPHLAETVFNSVKPLKLSCLSGNTIGVNYVWHNKKIHMKPGEEARDHDERRLYRNRSLDQELDLDRDVIFGIAIDEDNFYAFSLPKTHNLYSAAIDFIPVKRMGSQYALLNSNELKYSFSDLHNLILDLTAPRDQRNDEVKNIEDVVKSAGDTIKKRIEGVFHDQDPGIIFKDIITNQASFAKVIAGLYGNKCALREDPIVNDKLVGLEAAHIHARSETGPFSPTNGILLSRDLHDAFDRGYWTLTEDFKVEVHRSVEGGMLTQFHNKLITTNEVFKPYKEYIRWHQSAVFGRFD